MSELGRLDAPLMEERDHPVRPWAIAAALLLVVCAVAVGFYYAPLAAVGDTRCPPGAERVPGPESEDGTAGQELCLVTYESGRDMTFAATLRNEGRLPIGVRGLDFDAAVLDLVEVRGVRVGHGDGAAEPSPLQPFNLRPGEERTIVVDATLRPCEAGRAGRLVTLPAVPVRTRFAGLPRTAEVPLVNDVAVLLDECR